MELFKCQRLCDGIRKLNRKKEEKINQETIGIENAKARHVLVEFADHVGLSPVERLLSLLLGVAVDGLVNFADGSPGNVEASDEAAIAREAAPSAPKSWATRIVGYDGDFGDKFLCGYKESRLGS